VVAPRVDEFYTGQPVRDDGGQNPMHVKVLLNLNNAQTHFN